MRIKCRGIEFRMRWNFCNFFACSSFRVDKVSVAFAIVNILLGIATLYGSISHFNFDEDGFTIVSFSVGIGSVLLNIVASAFVIYGYFKRNPGFYLPYMMINAIVSIVLCLYITRWFIALFKESPDIKSVFLFATTLTLRILVALFETDVDNSHSFIFILMPLMFIFLSYPIYWSAYKSLNNDLQKRLNSIKETTTDYSTRQQVQQSIQQPTTLDITTVEFASPAAEYPCISPFVQQFPGTNTAAERASLHDSMADYKVI